ncbi:putative calcium-binding protein CML45 [Carex littledalei]|uniref:Putative calcium-binding protein CML45 n=1 Tax=Carex littledalei TaxID=544730 RepID=A0A833V419_9POAL|nr:putative calcium-binding protein CML45 [Carex littledalei]
MEAIIITFFLLSLILNFYVMITDKFYPKQLHYLYYILISHSDTRYSKAPVIEEGLNKTESTPEVDIKDVRINRDELAFVMERIGEPTTKEGEQTDNFCMGYGEFSALFQESEPSLDEVKEAFSVFDQNRDGLVDAQDLQRVLINLGIREGTNLEACQRMIAQHDRNKDGNVDLIDFSRLLEMSLLGNGD